jgi:hypothetical protein
MGNRASRQAINYSIRAPYEEEHSPFIKSFDVTDSRKEIQRFYEKYGFVVFRNVLTEEEISLSINDLWKEYPGADQSDPSTWSVVNQPHGFVGIEPNNGKQLWNNRQHPLVYSAFKMMYEIISGRPLKESLLALLARGSIMLPTTGPNGKEEYLVNRLPHFDLNPYVWCGMVEQSKDNPMYEEMYNSYPFLIAEGNNTLSHGLPKLRAVLQLSDSLETTGGLECLPGFHNQLKLWCEQHPPRQSYGQSDFSLGIAKGDPIDVNMQKMTVRKGSLILFSAELPHSMYPNLSEGFRFAQFLRMSPLSTLELSEEMETRRKKLLLEHIPKDLVITEIGREVFHLEF